MCVLVVVLCVYICIVLIFSFTKLDLVNHIADGKVKFDFQIDGMVWKSTTASLCMEYRFHSSGKSDDPSDAENKEKTKVGNAEFKM